MHEMGIAQSIVDIALSSIPEDMESPKVEKINLKIGKLAAVVEHSLTFCFEVITENTTLAGAVLHIESVPVRARCKSCGHTWDVEGPDFTCPGCQDGEIELLTGREIDIISLELADDE